jgi:hypothetical protein
MEGSNMAPKCNKLDENAFKLLSTGEKIKSLQQNLNNGKLRILLNVDEQAWRGIQHIVQTALQQKGVYGQSFSLEKVKNQVKNQVLPNLKDGLAEHLNSFDNAQTDEILYMLCKHFAAKDKRTNRAPTTTKAIPSQSPVKRRRSPSASHLVTPSPVLTSIGGDSRALGDYSLLIESHRLPPGAAMPISLVSLTMDIINPQDIKAVDVSYEKLKEMLSTETRAFIEEEDLLVPRSISGRQIAPITHPFQLHGFIQLEYGYGSQQYEIHVEPKSNGKLTYIKSS